MQLAGGGPAWKEVLHEARERMHRVTQGPEMTSVHPDCVLVSFIGRGKTRAAAGPEPPSSASAESTVGSPPVYSGYVLTKYRFPAEGGARGFPVPSSFFGAALLRWLRQTGRPVGRWVVMGTAHSMWPAVQEGVHDPRQAGQDPNVQAESQRLWQASEVGAVTQEDLDRWAECLRPYMGGLDLRLRLVGAGDTEASQEEIWKTLWKWIPERAFVVLDITHGFRHQPVITAFMLTLLQWLRRFRHLDLYYGAFELAVSGEACPVLHLGLCNALLKASEAVATFHHTGNARPLFQCEALNLTQTLRADGEHVAYADAVNQPQPASSPAGRLRQALGRVDEPISRPLAELATQAVDWAAEPNLPRRLLRKARFAFQHSDYLKAITLLYEGFIQAGLAPQQRGKALARNARDHAWNQLVASVLPHEAQTLNAVKTLRNCVAHASPPAGDNPAVARVQAALDSPAEFGRVFEEGARLLEKIINAAGGSGRPGPSPSAGGPSGPAGGRPARPPGQ